MTVGIFQPTFSFIKFKSLGTKVKIHYKILLNNFFIYKTQKNIKTQKPQKWKQKTNQRNSASQIQTKQTFAY